MLESGVAKVSGTDRSVPISALARAAYHQTHSFKGEIGPGLRESADYDPAGTFSNACHVAMVAVDAETGRVALEKYLVVEDAGRIINPMIADGQVHGGVAQGIGNALFEEIIYDRNGNIQTATLADYMPPTAREIPQLELHHIETPTDASITGAKGLGEGGAIGAPAAILNAVNDALTPFGVSIEEVPATPQRIRAAIKASVIRPLARRMNGEPQVKAKQTHLDDHDENAGAVDAGKEDFDHHHGHDRREPHHRAPRRGEPQADRRHQIDDGKKHRRRLPRHALHLESLIGGRTDAADLAPMIEALQQRHPRHDAQEQNQMLGPRLLGRRLGLHGRIEHLARPRGPRRSAARLIAHPGPIANSIPEGALAARDSDGAPARQRSASPPVSSERTEDGQLCGGPMASGGSGSERLKG